MSADFWTRALELDEAHIPFVVVTLTGVRGQAPQDPGAKVIVTEKGLHWGTVGGGKVEARVIQDCKKLVTEILTGAAERIPVFSVTWNLQKDIGMTCGGEVSYVFEVHHRRSWDIVVFGAGHVAQALATTLSTLDCHATFIDPRAEWVDRLPNSRKITRLCLPEPAQFVEKIDARTYIIVMTQGHASDVPVLTAVLKKFPEPIYLGSIGSKVKAIRIRADLKAAGISNEAIAELQCPIGLPFGGNDPAEIAISVVGQLLQRRDQLRNPAI